MVNKIVYDPEGKLDLLYADAPCVQKDIKKLLHCLQFNDTLVIPNIQVLGESIHEIVEAAGILATKGIALYVGARRVNVDDISAMFGITTPPAPQPAPPGRPQGHKNIERAEQIYRLRSQNMSLLQIAEALGISKTTVQYYLTRRYSPP